MYWSKTCYENYRGMHAYVVEKSSIVQLQVCIEWEMFQHIFSTCESHQIEWKQTTIRFYFTTNVFYLPLPFAHHTLNHISISLSNNKWKWFLRFSFENLLNSLTENLKWTIVVHHTALNCIFQIKLHFSTHSKTKQIERKNDERSICGH